MAITHDTSPSASATAHSPAPRLDGTTPSRLFSQFNLAFSLMSIIPLLICCYLITVKFFTISALQGINGVYFLLAVIIALLGLLFGRAVIREIIRRLVDANTKLDRLNRMQASFVSNVAHEFRTPLAIIQGALDNVHDGLHGPLTPDQTEPIDMSRNEVNRLKRLVGDLLDLAQMESGKLRLRQDVVVLQELLTGVAKLFHSTLKERGLSLAVDVPDVPVRVIGDRDRLQQVFVNLITNAMKFTEQGGIRVRVVSSNNVARVEVQDTGRGIAQDDLDRIFDKFERVGSSGEEGSGLGLPIARDIVQLHHGRLWAESQFGKGSRFIVELPIEEGTHHAVAASKAPEHPAR